MSIYNDLAKSSFPGKSVEELNAIDNHASDALDGILTGLQSVGNLMFWAADSENYGGEMAVEDVRNIGEMLMGIMPVARALRDNADSANSQLRSMEASK